ncbi:MAG: hypothetical protein Q9O62_03385 [Ardenticatenia bacterium]|nr:hypothetical protein [Ardenticatenia bacterium]
MFPSSSSCAKGGISGFCEELTITGDGVATLTSCRFPHVTGQLTPEEQLELRELVLLYSPYEGGHRADPDVADDMTLWVQVEGLGRDPAPEDVVQQAVGFGQRLTTRLTPPEVNSSAAAPLSAYRQVAREAPHKAIDVLVAGIESYVVPIARGRGQPA